MSHLIRELLKIATESDLLFILTFYYYAVDTVNVSDIVVPTSTIRTFGAWKAIRD
jgi:hypothetical protein